MQQATDQGSLENLSFEIRQEIFDDAYSQGFDKGFQKAQERFVIERSRIISDAERRAMEMARKKPFMAMAHRNGYNEGYEIGYGKGFQKGQLAVPKNSFSYKDLEHARQRGYDEGFAAGRTRMAGDPEPDGVRNTVIDEVLNECKIIADSNPNMAPGVNAVRHRVRKLRKA
jgi:flagellar biosynthesis/type III secretory pathway protein FliH